MRLESAMTKFNASSSEADALKTPRSSTAVKELLSASVPAPSPLDDKKRK